MSGNPIMAGAAFIIGGAGLWLLFRGKKSRFLSPLLPPVRVTSKFGPRIHPIEGTQQMHKGVDFGAPEGTAIFATAGGVVTKSGEAGDAGLRVVIAHEGGWTSHYMHMSAINIGVGQQVFGGFPIGLVGSTGASTGPHLHFELRKDGEPFDPMELIA